MESTKQRILDMALDLFSKKGFSAVSIRDICTRVKIKESSIYYHFKNKQAILDELVCQFQDKATSMMAMFDKALSDSYFSSDSDFSLVFDYFFDRYLTMPSRPGRTGALPITTRRYAPESRKSRSMS